MYRRNATKPLLAALADSPVVLLNGARQTGKTTLVRTLKRAGRPAHYSTFDDAATLASATADPEGFIARFDGPIVLDEVQKAPELFPAIKIAVDRRRTSGRFLLTGSTNVLALPRLSESLAGRMEILTLHPLSQGEIAGAQEGFIDAVFAAEVPPLPGPGLDRRHLFARVLRGGYPEQQKRDEMRRAAWFGSYVTTILQRDVREIAAIEGLTALPRLLALLAARTMSLLNFADLSRETAIPQSTAKRYLALLEATFLVNWIPAWSSNLSSRLMKTPRIAFVDTGLAAHLIGVGAERLEEEPGRVGPLLENFVAAELRKQGAWNRVRAQLFHFRTLSGQEVDLVLENAAGKLVGIEVKATSKISATDFRGLKAFRELTGKRFHRGVLLYTGNETLPFGPDLIALPISALWTLGAREVEVPSRRSSAAVSAATAAHRRQSRRRVPRNPRGS